MKAISVSKYGGPEVLALVELPMPEPVEGQILIRVEAAGVNPVDTYLRSGAQGYAPPLPFTPGMDGSGVVVSVGPGVRGFETGMRVYTAGTVTGTYAEFCLGEVERTFPLPDGLDWAQGASLGVPYFTAARALFTRGRAAAGECVLIHGATGGVGLAALQLLRSGEYRVFGTAGTESGAALVEDQGARCFDHRDPGRFDAIRRAAGEGVDLIVEMLADANLDGDLKILAPGGRVVVVGSRGRIEIAPRNLMGVEGAVLGVRMPRSAPEDRREYARRIKDGVASGTVNPVVARRFPMTDGPEAHRAVMTAGHRGNIVLNVGGD